MDRMSLLLKSFPFLVYFSLFFIMLHFFHFSIAPVREEDNLLGDERHFCVRLSNQILANTVTFLLLMAYFRPKLRLMLEQPLSSWCFKQKNVLEAISRWNLRRFLTALDTILWKERTSGPTLVACKKLSDAPLQMWRKSTASECSARTRLQLQLAAESSLTLSKTNIVWNTYQQ